MTGVVKRSTYMGGGKLITNTGPNMTPRGGGKYINANSTTSSASNASPTGPGAKFINANSGKKK